MGRSLRRVDDDVVGLILAVGLSAAVWVLIGYEQKRHPGPAWRVPAAKKLGLAAAVMFLGFMGGVSLGLWE